MTPEEKKQYHKEHYQQNKRKLISRSLQYYYENQEKVKEYQRQWRRRNADRIREYNKAMNEARRKENALIAEQTKPEPETVSIPTLYKLPEPTKLGRVTHPDWYTEVRLNVQRGYSTKLLSKEDDNKFWKEFFARVKEKYTGNGKGDLGGIVQE